MQAPKISRAPARTQSETTGSLENALASWDPPQLLEVPT
jgi:hypothetical protein